MIKVQITLCNAKRPGQTYCNAPPALSPPIGGIPGTGVTSIKAKIGNSRLLWPGPLLANLLICAHEGETSNGLIKVTIQTPLSGCVWVKNNQVCNKYSFHWHITPEEIPQSCTCVLVCFSNWNVRTEEREQYVVQKWTEAWITPEGGRGVGLWV